MMNKWMGLFLIFYMCFLLVCGTGVNYYTNQWLAHVPLGEVAAKIVAQSNDMKYEGPVEIFKLGVLGVIEGSLINELKGKILDGFQIIMSPRQI